jgi:hypothetical protein
MELPKLLVLLVIMIVGWVLLWRYVYHKDAGAVAKPNVVVDRQPPPPIVPDRSIGFESVVDKQPVGLRDMAAYAKLLDQARSMSAADLASRSRHDVLINHLADRPSHYRGVPIYLFGSAKKAFRYDSKLSPTGWLYEIWIASPDSPKNPFVCICEDPPQGFPIGADISERVVFNGYFFKLMKYEAGDVPRWAPLLVGKLGWEPSPSGQTESPRPIFWMALAIGIMFLISLARWIYALRRSLTVKRLPRLMQDRPTEEIAPEQLAQYFQNIAEDEEELPPEPKSSS